MTATVLQGVQRSCKAKELRAKIVKSLASGHLAPEYDNALVLVSIWIREYSIALRVMGYNNRKRLQFFEVIAYRFLCKIVISLSIKIIIIHG